MTALPTDINTNDLEPNALSAYNVCLAHERDAKTDNDVVHAKLLGYLILHAPSLTALREVAKVIYSCSQDYNAFSELGESFIKHFIRPFKKHKGRTPASSDHPSRPSSDKYNINLISAIQEAPKDHKDAKKRALIRDGFKCVVTGQYDMGAGEISSIDEEEMCRAGAVYTECAHIVPESTYFNVSTTCTSSPEKKNYSADVLAVLKRFGYDVENLNGAKVHTLFNIMTMQKDVHDWFDRLEMWFETTTVNNCYCIKTVKKYYQVPEKITFVSPNPIILPVPSPELLALHAACAKVAHLSGAGAYIDKLDRDTDDLGVLAHDGGSSDVLSHALLRSLSSTTNSINVGA